jgi:hypothetical protein
MLMLIPGHALGAVADIISADLTEEGSPAVTLTLDVVHQPRMVSEFEEHPQQTLDDHAHYHFFTPAGVSVDAAKFLSVSQAAGNRLPGEYGRVQIACTQVYCRAPGGMTSVSPFDCGWSGTPFSKLPTYMLLC